MEAYDVVTGQLPRGKLSSLHLLAPSMRTHIYFSALQLLVRSILCNWLVCIAIWQANACSTMPGELLPACCC